MWGGGPALASRMNAPERAAEILDQPVERQLECRAPADQAPAVRTR
jgi:hypothetical protein